MPEAWAALAEAGQVGEALAELRALAKKRALTPEEAVSECELLDLVSSSDYALENANRLMAKQGVRKDLLARCSAVVGSQLLRLARVEEGVGYYSRALKLATEVDELKLQSHLYVRRFESLTSWVGPDAALADAGTVRRFVTAAGLPQLTVRFRLALAELDAKRGALRRAKDQLEIAGGLLSQFGNALLSAERCTKGAVVAMLASDLTLAQQQAKEALRLNAVCGSTSLEVVVRTNLAHILLCQGDQQQSASEFQHALRLCRSGGGAELGIRDGMALHALAFGDDETIERRIEEACSLSLQLLGGYSYYGLWHLLTRVKWLLRTNRAQEAVDVAIDAIPRVERMADRNLLERMKLVAAEALGAAGRPLDGAELMAEAVRANPDPPLDMVAEASRVEGCLANHDDPAAARTHFERAGRIYSAIGNQTARDEVLRLAGPGPTALPPLAVTLATPTTLFLHEPALHPDGHARPGARLVESVAAVMELATHPALLGIETLALLDDTHATARSALVEEDSSGTRRVVASVPRGLGPGIDSDRVVVIPLGTLGTRTFRLLVEPRPLPSARATVLALERLLHSSLALAHARQIEREQAALWPEQTPEQQLGLICAADAMVKLVKTTRRIATTNVTVLITGETGAGKEVFARALHQASGRRDRIFLPFNCTAVPRDMLDSQLFGYRKGAFTGAHDDFAGLIRSAAGGTLLLDEIGEMSPEVQPKLLRFLESGEILPLGETRPQTVDVRIVAATNADLDQLVVEGRFREDLFYRLNVIRLPVPPLRERREEIPLLVGALLEKFAREVQKTAIRVAEETMEYLVLFDWPGNVRQLSNELRRLAALAEPGTLVTPDHLTAEIVASRRPLVSAARGDLSAPEVVVSTNQSLGAATDDLERRFIAQALEQTGGNVERAAQILGLSRKGLFLKRQRLGLH